MDPHAAHAAPHDQQVHTIHLSDAERQGGAPSLEFIAEAVAFLHKDGILIIDNAIDPLHLDRLNDILVPEALEMARSPARHFNFGAETRNMDQAPPPIAELMYKDVWANAFALAALSAILGPRPAVHYAMGNTALPAGSDAKRQPVHSDVDFEHGVYAPWSFVVNINLIDTDSRNGATEFWPGSHHVSTPECHEVDDTGRRRLEVQKHLVEERRRHSPPVQCATRRGSLIIRDLRLWHAGRPNLSGQPRIMLAFVYQGRWFQGKGLIPLPRRVRGLIESWRDEVCFCVEWRDEVDTKELSSANVDFSSGSAALARYGKELNRWPDYTPRWY